ncbi:MAG: superoxide dismutase [Burkholderia sp.]|jgi:Cu-Zn family superoxide dismutase|nr:superoxide dismutase [Burkholderia sp.]
MKLLIALVGVAALVSCQTNPSQSAGKQARASLEAKSGSNVAGNVDFVEQGAKTLVSVKVRGLKPNSQHGFHVHEKGDCSSADALTAGGHFNPDGNPHAHAGEAKRHAGDLVNLVADGNGESNATFEVDTIRVDDGKHGILNRAVIIHANPDDYVSQPVGNAGGRIACGLIRKS